MNFVDYSTLIRDLLIDFSSLYFMSYVILYRKFRNTEMFVSCALFNIFVMLIVMAIVRTDFNMAVGFGLFALLSLVQLRSAQFTKTEVAYLFGAVALAVINGAGIADMSVGRSCKSGVNGLVLPMARDLMDVGIRVNSVMPGIFATPLMLGMKDRNPQMWDQLNASVPFPKRLGHPEEFASLILEIARNSYINAHQFRLDGAIRMPPK